MYQFIIILTILISSATSTYGHLNIKIPIEPLYIDKSNYICPNYLTTFSHNFNQEQGEFIIKKISSIFPQVDSISHIVLHNSDILINCILNNIYIPIDIKKNMVLLIVHFIQFGDSSGGVILNFYNDLVNCLL
tara:strand:- start:863 stop:1261 length:399 start_codon:yes stop_codon:yes gene_type:complete